jgi:hypothetical protein
MFAARFTSCQRCLVFHKRKDMSCGGENAKSVEACIQNAPEFARPICRTLRDLIQRAAPELRETIKWGNPCYEGRRLVCGLAAFQKHVRLFFFRGARVPDPDRLFTTGEDNARGRAIKFSSVDEIPVKKLEALVRAASKLDAAGAAQSRPRVRRLDLPMPKDFTVALKQSPKAQALFETLPQSCRREYIEWITTAKKEETRARRLRETLALLAQADARLPRT